MHVPHLGVYLTHRNSPIRYMLSSPYLIGPIILAIFLAKSTLPMSNKILGCLLAGIGIVIKRREIIAAGIRGSLLKSLNIARNALKEVKPDAVVAFSWGGCLACLLLREGSWNGPTLLLAPAYELLLQKAMLPCPLRLEPKDSQAPHKSVLLIHSEADQIVLLWRFSLDFSKTMEIFYSRCPLMLQGD